MWERGSGGTSTPSDMLALLLRMGACNFEVRCLVAARFQSSAAALPAPYASGMSVVWRHSATVLLFSLYRPCCAIMKSATSAVDASQIVNKTLLGDRPDDTLHRVTSSIDPTTIFPFFLSPHPLFVPAVLAYEACTRANSFI